MTYHLGTVESFGHREIRVVLKVDAMISKDARRYGFAILASGTAFGVVMLLARVFPFEPFLLFAIPIALTSRYAGRGPTALAVILTVMAIFAALPIPTHSELSSAMVWLRVGVFAVVGFAIDSSSEALRKARRDAERSAAHLEDMNVELEQQMDQIQTLSEDLSRTNLSLAAARDAAEGASRAREEMLAVVAHDLRNPLNLVMMTAQLLADIEPSRERRDQLLAVIQRAAQRMNRLIEDLLEIVRQESGQMALDVQDISATSLLAQTAEMFQSIAMEKGVSLRITDAPADLEVRGDAERIMQVMSNVGGNALKFVPRGGSVELKCEQSGAEAIFSVTDSGPGIAPDDLHKLFERFWQRRRSDKRGVGLGLAIARGIVEAHGGRIWAESRVGSGSTFYFTLPASQSATINGSPVPNILVEDVA